VIVEGIREFEYALFASQIHGDLIARDTDDTTGSKCLMPNDAASAKLIQVFLGNSLCHWL